MSTVTAVPIRPLKRGSLLRLWVGLAALVLAAFLLAKLGAGSFHNVEVDTVAAGHGDAIGPMDGVLIEYRGTTDDGTVFDQTQPGQPAPLLVGETVPGFSQALQKMKEGGSYRVLIPGRLAYGDHPPKGGPIGPNADLHFDMTVVRVVKNAAIEAAAAQQAQQQMQQQQHQGQTQPETAPAR